MSPNFVILVDDRVRDAGLTQTYRRKNARHARTDDQHVERLLSACFDVLQHVSDPVLPSSASSSTRNGT